MRMLNNMAASRKKQNHFLAAKSYFLNIMWLTFLLCCCFSSVLCDDCKVHGFSLNQLAKFDYWESTSLGGNISYKIHLCGSVNSDCHNGTSVCMKKGGKSYSIGNITNPSNITAGKNDQIGEVWIVLVGDQCPEDNTEKLHSVINMKCGKTLGSPQYLTYEACTTYFEWISSAVCTNVTVPEKEVPCYVLDDHNDKYDLNALIKLKGGYLVDSTEGWDFYINVCRDITPDSQTTSCPKGTAACKVKGQTVINLGQPQDRLKRLQDGKLRLTYTSDQTPDVCTQKPNTTIDFICPKSGGSRDPLLISDFNCHYYVQWYTERACKEQSITSKSCILHNEESNIDIDLTPLSQPPGAEHPYYAYHKYANGQYPYKYYINICGELGIQCPDDNHVKGIAACQTQVGNASYGMIMGKVDHQQLSYADGQLRLTYTGGDVCNHTKFQRSTVILFNCNKTAGRGSPVFDRENDCVYLFQWNTSYACLDHPVVKQCRINYNGQRYDLSSLVRRTGKNWEVLQSKQTGSQYFINICNDLILEGKASGCPPDSSVCFIDGNGKTQSLGKYSSNPFFDPISKTIRINYTDGESCGNNKKKYSVITLLCRPGDLESGPVLITTSLDGCVNEFEWYTAAVCVLARIKGTNCRVFDDDLGFNFDLTKLKKNNGGYYNATGGGEYDYKINVCGPVTTKPCGNVTNPGVCQLKHGENRSYNTGQFSSTLLYFDGMINLTYANGDRYHSGLPRKTEIAFVCNRDIGVGHPEFIDESHNTYSFIWRTSYVCPSQPVECTATDPATKKQYDLSRLTRKGSEANWAIEDNSNPHAKLIYYINVCRQLNGISMENGARLCSSFASVCRTRFENGTEAVDLQHTDMGEVQGGPVVEGDGRLVLTYVGSATCSGSTNKMTTKIHFICKKGDRTTGPSPPVKVNDCLYTSLWETEAACPIEDVVSTKHEACTLKDPNSDYVFNLRPLNKNGTKDYFTVKSNNGHTYRVRICGSLTKHDCDEIEGVESAVCEVLANGSKPGLAYARQTLEFSDDGKLQLTYDGKRSANGQRVSVKILFQCRKNVEVGEPVLSRIIENTYFFTFETPLACPPEPVDCLVQDSKGNQYDLSPLARTSQNWKVLDTRDPAKNHTYYINVCRPVAPIIGSTCPGGPVGGCQIVKDGRSFNMGYIQSKPVAREDGTITLRYRNGDVCHKGTPRQAHRSTRINFYCSTVEHNPTFEGETETCEYVFNWQTPSACANQRVLGTDCHVTDPLYNQEFDFHPLRLTGGDYHVRVGEYEYLLNLCGPLNTQCNQKDDSAVCQTKINDKSYQINAGLAASSQLVYDSGEITLTFNGGKGSCHNTYTRSTIITFLCDQSQNGISRGPTFLNESADCTYMFEWQTSLACPPYKIGDCSATDPNGNEYDLSILSLTKDNIDYIDHYQKKKYIINVCRSLVHQKDETCPPNSAVCIVDLDQTNNTKKFHNIGEVNENQVLYKDGRLQLFYDNGDVCEANKTQKMSARIIMQCDPNAIDTHPTGHFTVGCEHRFVWYTRAACPLHKTGQSKSGNCTVSSPRTGVKFDLSSLSLDSGYEFSDHRGHTFKINVCNPVKGSKCTANSTGACQEDGNGAWSHNAGNFNKNLQYDDGVLFLNYTDGDTCHGKFKRNIIINFVCSKTAGRGTPVFIDETDDCTYYIAWHTSLVCDQQMKCSVDMGSHTVDLSPLIKTIGFHLAISTLPSATTSNSTFYINVCEPLNPIYGTLCPAGSSACVLQNGHKPLGLGKLHRSPSVDKAGKIVLVYDHGDPSPTNPSKNVSTKIIFSCKPGPSQGTPYLEQITSDYEYIFSWETNVVCVDEIKTTSDCTFTDPQSGMKFNLTSLNSAIPYKVHSKAQNVDYLVSICENLKSPPHGCPVSGICRVNGQRAASMGKATNVTFHKYLDMYRMDYMGGDNCLDKSVNSGVINFKCDFDGGQGKPTLLSDNWCGVQFEWKTRAVCSPIAEDCTLVNNGHLYDLSMLSSQRGNWNLTDAAGNKYWINVCQGVHKGPRSQSCPNIAGACRKTKSGQIDSLGIVETQKLYMDTDGKTLVLKYSHGDSACADKHRRSNNPSAVTIIKFECGKTVGGPVYVPRKSDGNSCVFEFHWKSRIACRIQREKLTEKDMKLNDPETGRIIDLHKIKGHYTIPGDNKYSYSIDLSGKACGRNTVVCKQYNSENHVLASLDKREYYMEDGILEVVHTSPDRCDKDGSKYVKTIIQFHCNTSEGIPEFFSESRDCVYVFTWGTPVLCLSPNVINPVPLPSGGSSVSVPGTGSGSGGKSSPVGAIVGVFSAAIFICILLIIFHKKERRVAFASRVKRLVRRSEYATSFKYDALPQTSDNEDDENAEIMVVTNATSFGTTDDSTAIKPVESYHDDSDEDLLQ